MSVDDLKCRLTVSNTEIISINDDIKNNRSVLLNIFSIFYTMSIILNIIYGFYFLFYKQSFYEAEIIKILIIVTLVLGLVSFINVFLIIQKLDREHIISLYIVLCLSIACTFIAGYLFLSYLSNYKLFSIYLFIYTSIVLVQNIISFIISITFLVKKYKNKLLDFPKANIINYYSSNTKRVKSRLIETI